MADVGDIRPAQPIWPKRRIERTDHEERPRNRPPKEGETGRERKDGEHDSDNEHVDEYV
jgi:hypothetical protein